MRQTPLRRRKPLRTSRTKKRKAPRRIAKMTAEERAYAGPWLHAQRCTVCVEIGVGDCGPIQQAHFRDMTGIGLKEPPMRSIALGRPHHEDYDQAKGYFGGWSRDQRKDWFVLRIAESNTRFLRERYAGGSVPF